jgi:hypothetical protein
MILLIAPQLTFGLPTVVPVYLKGLLTRAFSASPDNLKFINLAGMLGLPVLHESYRNGEKSDCRRARRFY